MTPFYDPMIAKLIVHAATRDAAAAALAKTCADVQVWPVRSNAAFLARLAGDGDFRSGQVDTGLIGRKFEELTQAEPITPALATTALSILRQRTGQEIGREWPIGDGLDGFRVNAAREGSFTLYADGEPVDAALPQGNPWADEDFLAQGFLFDDKGAVVFEGGGTHIVALAYRPGAASGTAADGAILSPMPGRIIAVEVAAGDRVTKGQKLVTLEAMKMEHSLVAPFDGTVAELDAVTGGQVTEGKLLARVDRE